MGLTLLYYKSSSSSNIAVAVTVTIVVVVVVVAAAAVAAADMDYEVTAFVGQLWGATFLYWHLGITVIINLSMYSF